jgi:hypothetical protein
MLALASYDAKRGCEISDVDPGAVPGRSTKVHPGISEVSFGGPETGSTRVVKVFCGVRYDSAVIGSSITNANDNSKFVAANDNSFVAGDVRKAA